VSSLDAAAETVVVLDFETTGLSPDYGDRAIEIGAVKLVARRPATTPS
jgi:DNA polymerase-3 subunit epsilon